jgi:hypothetical protein
MAFDPVDSKKIATGLAERAIDRIIAICERKFKSYWAEHKNKDISSYARYLERKGTQARAIKNFIYESRSASLYDIYVQPQLSIQDIGDYSAKHLIALLANRAADPKKRPAPAYIVSGHAGVGKSLLMKHAFFELQAAERIPILIEARSFNNFAIADLETRIHDDFLALGSKISRNR